MHKNFIHKVKVYYEDTDLGGVVYHANYLKFFERARTEALITLGFSNKKIKDIFKVIIVVKSCRIDYKKPAYLEDELLVKSFVKSTTKASLLMSQQISNKEDLIAEATIHLVFINEKSKPIKIPEILLEYFKPYTEIN
tara:strand:- start:381 stop:794 length:414 start_codon:yes stop_codon:yes gene_type:complete